MHKSNSAVSPALAEMINKYYLTRVAFDVPDALETQQMLGWLREVWEFPPVETVSGDVLEAWLKGVRAISQKLFELAAMPLFDLPKIKKIAWIEQGSRFFVDLETRVIDGVDSVTYRDIYQVATRLCLWMGRHSDTPENREILFDDVSRRVIERFKGVVPSGKSTIPLLRVAHGLGIPYMHLGLGIYQLGWGCRARRLDRSATERDSAQGSRLTLNKTMAIQLMGRAGLPVPAHALANKVEQVRSLSNKMRFPWVVKPMALDRGEGVHVDLFDENAAIRAFNAVAQLTPGRPVVVERQVPGVCHRIFVAQGRVLYVVKRDPMSVFGDGFSTVQELVAREHELQATRPPWLRSGIKPLDDAALAEISRCGLDKQSVPARGQKVSLRRIESTLDGGVDEDVTAQIHPENMKIALSAARLFDLDVAGIDLISEDISVPWYENGAVLIEVNFAPLLGGAAISRSYLPQFFERMVPDLGLIPIRVFQGAHAKTEALKARDAFLGQGVDCFWLDDDGLYDPVGTRIELTSKTLADRCRAALLNRHVAALVIWTDFSDQ